MFKALVQHIISGGILSKTNLSARIRIFYRKYEKKILHKVLLTTNCDITCSTHPVLANGTGTK